MPFDGTTNPTLETLIRARQILAENGWCQGVLWDHRGRVCAIGALLKGHDLPWQDDRSQILPALGVLAEANQLAPAVERGCSPEALLQISVVTWNNAEGRTKEEVLDAFDRAIGSLIPRNPGFGRAIAHSEAL
jgi:hypothetical protein